MQKYVLEDESFDRVLKLRDNFLLQVHDVTLYDYQKAISDEIIKSVLLNDGKTLAAQVTRQAGKTTMLSLTAQFLMLFYGEICEMLALPAHKFFNVGFFAPQMEQARTGFTMLQDGLVKAKEHGFVYDQRAFNGNTIHLTNPLTYPRMAYCFTAAVTSRPESKTLNLIILDEAQDMDDKQLDRAIMPMGANTNATVAFIGVGGYQKCRFWDVLNRLPDSQKVKIVYKVAIAERQKRFEAENNLLHLGYSHHIEQRKWEIGEDSDEFRTQYLLEWILERGQFITYNKLMECKRKYELKGFYGKLENLVMGIDWGKVNDPTVCTIVDANTGYIVDWVRLLGDDYSDQISYLVKLINNKFLGLKQVYCDATATQDMAVDVLRSELKDANPSMEVRVEGVKFTRESKDQMYKNLYRLLVPPPGQEFRVCFPDIVSQDVDRFVKEMVDLQKDVKGNYWVVDHPDAPQYHDDYCDSLALACWGWRPRAAKASVRMF